MHEANGDDSPPTVVILMEESWPMWAARSTTSRPRRLMRLGLVHGRHPGGIVAYVDSQSDGFLPSAARVGYSLWRKKGGPPSCCWSTVVILAEESWPKWTVRTTAFCIVAAA